MTVRMSLIVAALAGCFLTLGQSAADTLSPNALYEKTLRSTCWVRLPRSWGSGSLVDKEKKWIVTSAHVVQNSPTVTVYFPVFDAKGKVIVDRDKVEKAGRPVRGSVIRKDSSKDLALIQLDSLPEGATEIKLADKPPQPGDMVHSVGCGKANGCLFAYHAGMVRQVCKRSDSYAGVTIVNCRVLETQSPHNPGDSGGPCVNERGEQVGVTASYVVPAQLMSFHIDVAEVHDLLKKVTQEKLDAGKAEKKKDVEKKAIDKKADDTSEPGKKNDEEKKSQKEFEVLHNRSAFDERRIQYPAAQPSSRRSATP